MNYFGHAFLPRAERDFATSSRSRRPIIWAVVWCGGPLTTPINLSDRAIGCWNGNHFGWISFGERHQNGRIEKKPVASRALCVKLGIV